MRMSQRLFVCLLTCTAATWSRESLKLGSVEDNKLGSHSGCALQLPSQFAKKAGKYIFVSDQESALLNVNGADVLLHPAKPRENDSKGNAKAGDHATQLYSGEGFAVRVDYTVTDTCPRANESCTVIRYDAILSVKHGKAGKTVAAKAVCGN